MRRPTEGGFAARLNHPNILMLHDSGVAEGRPYFDAAHDREERESQRERSYAD